MVAKTMKPITNFMNTSAMTRPFFMLGAAAALVGAGPAAAGSLNPTTLPTGGTVVGGQATISESGNTLDVDQSSNRTVIDWRSFDIGSKAQANFYQPNSSSIAINRVNGSANASQIEGGLHANGQVWILNPNGVFFGKTARVDAAGIVATTANVNDKKFMAGDTRLHMSGADHGSVVNEGHITVGNKGLAAFVAPSVRNSGTIRARLGKVELAAGTTYTLDLAGDHLVELGLGSVKAVVDDSGRIVNPGGTVTLTAKAASAVVDSVVNVSGIINASSAKRDGGDIVLGGDDVTTTSSAVLSANAGTKGDGGQIKLLARDQGNYDGSLSAKGGSVKGSGGTIETSGKNVALASGVSIDASAKHGRAGTWKMDPSDITIDNTEATFIDDQLNLGDSVDLSTSGGSGGQGDITLTSSVNATSTNNASLTLDGRHLSETGGSNITINGGALTLDVNDINNSSSVSGSWITDALNMIGSVSGGTTINLGAGTYTVPTGSYIFVNKSDVTINGASEDGTIIDASSDGEAYSVRVWGNDVSLNDLTILGSTSGYGVKVETPEPEAQSDRIDDFSISNVTIEGSKKNGLDLNAVVGATIDNVDISNTTAGTGIAITDSANVTITNSTTTNNAWGGVALYQHNAASNQQMNNIVIDGTNTFNESTPIYMEDQSASLDFGSVTIDGYNYVARAQLLDSGFLASYQWFQKTQQKAIDFAANVDAAAGSSISSVEGWTGTALNNIFTVGFSTGGTALSIQAAIDAATSGAMINVLAGTYNQTLDIDKNVDIEGAGIGQTIIQPTSASQLIDTGVGHKYDNDVKTAVYVHDANNVTLDGLTIDANNLGANAVVFWNNASGEIENSLIENPMAFTGSQTGQDLAVDSTAGNTSDLTVSNVTFKNWNKDAIDAVTGDGATSGGGNITLTVEDSTFTGRGNTGTIAQNGIEMWDYGGGTVTGTIEDNTISGISYANDPADAAASIYLIGAKNVEVEGNTVTGAGTGYSIGLYSYGSTKITSSGNTFKNLSTGIYVPTYSGISSSNITITGDTVKNDGIGIDIDPATANVTISGVTFANNNIQFEGSSALAASVFADTSNTFDKSVLVQGGGTIFSSIQDGVDAASSGGTVDVGAGTYVEQVDIDKSLTLIGAGAGQTIIDAPDNMSVSATESDGTHYAILAVTNGATASISDLTVDGLGNGDSNYEFDGIGVYNSNATISNVDITGIRNGGVGGTLNGAQSGVGVDVYNTDGVNRTVTLENSSIEDFQKNATAFDGGNLTVDVVDNTITGSGSTDLIAQNGIQFYGISGDGNGSVTGVISGNTISGISYQPATNTASTDILLLYATGTVVKNNTVTGSGKSGDSSFGLYAYGSKKLTISGNTFENLTVGAFLYGDAHVSVSGDTFKNNGTGLYAYASSTTGVTTDHGIQVSDNSFSGNAVQFQGASNQLADVFADNTFDKAAYASGGDEISSDLQATINGASTGATVNAEGNFVQDVSVDTQLSFDFDDVTVKSFTLGTGGAGSSLSGDLTATGAITLNGASELSGDLTAASITLNGAATLLGDTTLDATGAIIVASVDGTNAGKQDLTLDGSSVSLGDVGDSKRLGALTDTSDTTLTGSNYDAASFDFGALTLADNASLNATGAITIASVDGATVDGQDLTLKGASVSLGDVGSNTSLGALTDKSATTLTGSQYDAASFDFGALTLADSASINATGAITIASVDGTAAGAQDLTLQGSSVSLGDAGATTALGAVTDTSATTLTGPNYDAASFDFGALTLADSASIDATGAITIASVDGKKAGAQDLTLQGSSVSLGNVGASKRLGALTDTSATTLTGTDYEAASMNLGALTLTGNTSLNATGAITVASVDGTSVGAQALTLQGSSVNLGNVGTTTGLGVLTDKSTTKLTGSNYDASSIDFEGDVTLTADTTTFNTTQSSTAAGDITVGGNIFGTTNGGQSLVLIAGPGTGAASANGNISLQNAGTASTQLGNLTVSGNNFTALTVDLAGNFTSTLTGNQVFAADTLNAGGDVNSTVGGNASGHIVAGGDVTLDVGGNLTGDISGDDITLAANDVTNSNVTGKGDVDVKAVSVTTTTINGQNVDIKADTVDATVDATDQVDVTAETISGSYDGDTVSLNASKDVNATVQANVFDVNAPQGAVNGTWTTIDVSGSGTIEANGQPVLGNNSINPNELVVEGFVLPAGTTVSASGELVLPQGVVIGLLSPGGDSKPKLILVHSVQELGSLLASGYMAIVIDLSGHRKDNKIQLASN
jgi:filamentous hemagglutinin family protein